MTSTAGGADLKGRLSSASSSAVMNTFLFKSSCKVDG